MGYNDDLKVTLEDLGDDWLGHPQKFMHWGEEWAHSVRKRDKAKENLDIVKAEIDSAIRKDWTDFDFESKPTEAAIAAAIVKSKAYGKANEELAEAIETMNIMSVAKSAFEHRKKALEYVTQLYLSGYYGSNPQIQETDGVVDKKQPLGDPQQKALQRRRKLIPKKEN